MLARIEPLLRRNRKWLGRTIIFGPLAIFLYIGVINRNDVPGRPPAPSTSSPGVPATAPEVRRSLADDAARAAADTKAAADRAQRERDDQTRREIADSSKKLNQLRVRLSAKINQIRTDIGAGQKTVADQARRADFSAFSMGTITPEDTASPAACSDPAGTLDMLDRTKRRDRNILGCAVYYAQHIPAEAQQHPGNPTGINLALAYRVHTQTGARAFPLPTLFAYVWDTYLAHCLEAGATPEPMPTLMSGESFNPALFHDAVTTSFARRLIDTATAEEKLELTNVTYPAVQRMVEVGTAIAKSCQKIGKDECRRPPTR